MKRILPCVLFAIICSVSLSPSRAQTPFSELVGQVSVQRVAGGDTLTVPYITWGGDVATFMANGGLETKARICIWQRQIEHQVEVGRRFCPAGQGLHGREVAVSPWHNANAWASQRSLGQ